MALEQSSEALRRPQRVLRVAFPVIAVIALVLGYLGLGDFLTGSSDFAHRPIDLGYDDLQLFVLGCDPLQQTGGRPIPFTLEVARFAAPAVTIYAVVEAIRLLLAVEVSRFRARHSSGHAIVCGDSALADALTRRLQAEGSDVVEIRTEPDEFITPGEALRIIGDARDPEVLRGAGLEHAARLYACADSSATNFAISMAVTRTAARRKDPLVVHSLVTDPDFCSTVQAFFLARPALGPVRLDFFNVEAIAARRLFSDDPLTPVAGRAPSLLVAGTDGLGAAVIVEAARSWRTSGHRPLQQLPVSVVGTGAAELLTGLVQRYPFLSSVCDLHSIDGDLLALIRAGELTHPPDRALITSADEEYALMTAMTAERYWRGRSGSITVRLDGALIGGPSASGPLDVAAGSLRVFGTVAAAGDPQLIGDDLTERLARVLHDHYLIGRRARGDVRGGRAMVAWDELPGQLRRENRLQAQDIGRKLALVGCVITPRHAEQPETQLDDQDVDLLAEVEHRRWCTEQLRAGWRYAPAYDEQHKLHPSLVTWDRLPDTFRQRNYDPVRELPAILGDAGFQIVRA